MDSAELRLRDLDGVMGAWESTYWVCWTCNVIGETGWADHAATQEHITAETSWRLRVEQTIKRLAELRPTTYDGIPIVEIDLSDG